MTKLKGTYDGDFEAFRILHSALLIGLILIAALLYYLQDGEITDVFDAKDIFTYVVPFVTIFGLIGSFFFSRKRLKAGAELDDIESKILEYRSISIQKWALLEASGMISTLAFFMTNNINFLWIAIALMIILGLSYPSKGKFIRAFKLKKTDRLLITGSLD